MVATTPNNFNPNFSFQLSYCGVPFVSDMAHTFEPTGNEFISKLAKQFRSESSLYEEIDRLIPFRYLQDFALPTDFQGRNLSALARPRKIGPHPDPTIRIGDWYYPNTASRWSVFRGLATSTMVKQMVAACQTGGSTLATSGVQVVGSAPTWTNGAFVMQSPPLSPNNPQFQFNDDYSIQTNLFMLPPRPLGEGVFNNGPNPGLDGLYLVTLVDERYWWQRFPVSLQINQNTQWDDLIDQLGVLLGIGIDYLPTDPVYGQPEADSQLWCNFESVAVVLDAIAMSTGRTVVRNMDGTYTLQDSLTATQVAVDNRYGFIPTPTGINNLWSGQLASGGSVASGFFTSGFGVPVVLYSGPPQSVTPGQVVRIAGGEIFPGVGNALPMSSQLPVGDLTAAKNAALPANFVVTFPQYVICDDPVPHFVNTRYQNQRPSSWYEDSYGSIYAVNVPLLSGLASGLGYFSGVNTGGQSILQSGLVGTQGYTQVLQSTAKALYSGEIQISFGTPLNTSSLTALAVTTAASWCNKVTGEMLDEVYPGTYAWQPEALHDIVWTYSDRARLASTRVMKCQWNNESKTGQQAATALSGFTNIPAGAGGQSVAQTWWESVSGSLASGFVKQLLASHLMSGDMQAGFADVSYLPSQNRWRAQIDNEIVLFEGTSGGLTLGTASLNSFTQISSLSTFPSNGFFFPFQNNGQLKTASSTSNGIEVPGGISVTAGSPTSSAGIDVWSAQSVVLNNPGEFIPGQGTAFMDGDVVSIVQEFSVSSNPATFTITAVASNGVPLSIAILNPGQYDRQPISSTFAQTSDGRRAVGISVVWVNNPSNVTGTLALQGAKLDNNPVDNTVLFPPGTATLSNQEINAVDIVYRAIDNTLPDSHFASGQVIPLSGFAPGSGSFVQQLPSNVFGVNLRTVEKGAFSYHGAWTSGGIQEAVEVPQNQTVQLYDNSGVSLNGSLHFSGAVFTYDTSQSGQQYQKKELVWLVERNAQFPLSGFYYQGQLAGYSVSGPVAPVYLFSSPPPPASGSSVLTGVFALYSLPSNVNIPNNLVTTISLNRVYDTINLAGGANPADTFFLPATFSQKWQVQGVINWKGLPGFGILAGTAVNCNIGGPPANTQVGTELILPAIPALIPFGTTAFYSMPFNGIFDTTLTGGTFQVRLLQSQPSSSSTIQAASGSFFLVTPLPLLPQ